PGRFEIDEGLATVRLACNRCRIAEDLNARHGLEVVHCSLEVLDVEGEMKAANVAVLQRNLHLILRVVFEQLDVLAWTTAHHGKRRCGTRIDVQIGLHPVALWIGERSGRVDVFAPEHLGEEVDTLLQFGHSHPDVVDADHRGYPVSTGKGGGDEQ